MVLVSRTRSSCEDSASFASLTPTSTTLAADNPECDVDLVIHSVPEHSGLLVKVTPPRAPAFASHPRTPCDIVLVIDVSGSMGVAAPIPGGGDEGPDYGFSVLDLTKHAALTILETLNEGDRMGIVTFSTEAKVLRELKPVNVENKKELRDDILMMVPEEVTNLWHGIKKGLELFDKSAEPGRVPALMVLTDGAPNHRCPERGYVPALLKRDSIHPIIHTFGFGNWLRSGLLKAIADTGGGNFAFIPDSSMLGTVFVHAVANLQSTYANRATLTLKYPKGMQIEETTGISAATCSPVDRSEDGEEFTELTIKLGNLQYGQSRDIFLKVTDGVTREKGIRPVQAVVSFSRLSNEVYTLTKELGLDQEAGHAALSESEVAYHVSRSQICSMIGSLFRLKGDKEVVVASDSHEEGERKLTELLGRLLAPRFPDDECNASLVHELMKDKDGQIPLAVSKQYFGRWGAHYLLSLMGAHQRQVCTSFKDPGPLQYSKDSPLFARCRDALDEVFDNLEPPPSSLKTEYEGPKDMSSYRNVSGPCFAASTVVGLAGGGVVMLKTLKPGMMVQTPLGARKVEGVMRTDVVRQAVCRVGGVLVTPWHPVSLDGGESWVFPVEVAGGRVVEYTGSVYSVLLERDGNSAAHGMTVGREGMWGVTLGHGVVNGDDVRAHAFLGDYDVVKKALEGLRPARRSGRLVDKRAGLMVMSRGVAKDENGLVCRFIANSHHGRRRLRKGGRMSS